MRRENRNSDFFIKIFPFLISAVVAIIDCKINFIYAGSKGIDTLFSNLINVFAIIVGVLIALFGVLPSIHSSLIMERIREYDAESDLFYFCKETLFLNFLSLCFTILLGFIHSNFDLNNYNYIFNIWLFIVCSTLISSFKTILILLKISFWSSKKKQEIEKLDESESKKLKNKYVDKEKKQ